MLLTIHQWAYSGTWGPRARLARVHVFCGMSAPCPPSGIIARRRWPHLISQYAYPRSWCPRYVIIIVECMRAHPDAHMPSTFPHSILHLLVHNRSMHCRPMPSSVINVRFGIAYPNTPNSHTYFRRTNYPLSHPSVRLPLLHLMKMIQFTVAWSLHCRIILHDSAAAGNRNNIPNPHTMNEAVTSGMSGSMDGWMCRESTRSQHFPALCHTNVPGHRGTSNHTSEIVEILFTASSQIV